MAFRSCSPLLLCAALAAQGLPGARVETIDGQHLTGEVSIDAAGTVTLAVRPANNAAAPSVTSSAAATFALDGVASMEFATLAKPVTANLPDRVWLRSGQQFAAKALRGVPAGDGKPARLAADLALGCTLEFPLTTLRAFRHGGDGRPDPASFTRDLGAPADSTDLLFVRKDDKEYRFQVAVNGMRPDAIEFDLRGAARDFALDGVQGVVFGVNTGFAVDRQKEPRVAIDFDTGDHLEGKLLALGADVTLRLDEGCEVHVPSTRMVRLVVASDRLRWLSDLTPNVEQTAAFDRVWPWTRDRSLAGPGFIMGSRTWARGLGMVPRTKLIYDLGGNYDVFEATIGIDDRGGPQAHAILRVYVDGKVAFESQPCTRGMPPQLVRLELGKCKQLALEADFGKNYDLGDYCVFADARVMRN